MSTATIEFSDQYRKIALAINSKQFQSRLRKYRKILSDTASESPRVSDTPIVVKASSAWLPSIEEKIRDSVGPLEGAHSAISWISQDAAAAAIAFFRCAADQLPAEPFIYSSKQGDLVAEFSYAQGNFTAVMCDTKTILFGVNEQDVDSPVQIAIRRGSNRTPEEMREFLYDIGSRNGVEAVS